MNRRSFLTGLGSLIVAPAIVRAGSLMPVKALPGWLNEASLEEALVRCHLKLIDKSVKERTEYLEPAKIRDLKMVVVTVAGF